MSETGVDEPVVTSISRFNRNRLKGGSGNYGNAGIAIASAIVFLTVVVQIVLGQPFVYTGNVSNLVFWVLPAKTSSSPQLPHYYLVGDDIPLASAELDLILNTAR
ncbi:MAG: hypothetical protein QW767_02405 [Thermoprotei archaeon]